MVVNEKRGFTIRMDLFEIIAIAVGLSMDAFAVAICKGLAAQKTSAKHYIVVGLWFGGFQCLMPIIGYFVGSVFAEKIKAVDHWVAFVLLLLIGANMLREAFSKEEEHTDASLSFFNMFLLALATSIDALAVGVTFSFEMVAKYALISSGLIGVVTFALSALGVKIGSVFGSKYKSKAEIAGGIILIGIGIKILVEGLIAG